MDSTQERHAEAAMIRRREEMRTSIRHSLVGWVLVPGIVAGFVVFGAVAVIGIGVAEKLVPDRRPKRGVTLRVVSSSEERDAGRGATGRSRGVRLNHPTPRRLGEMVDESSAALSKGEEHGRFEENGAGDCPYMPGQPQAELDNWMPGFSKSRAKLPPLPTDGSSKRQSDTPHVG